MWNHKNKNIYTRLYLRPGGVNDQHKKLKLIMQNVENVIFQYIADLLWL
jgi:hypothetical protein